MTNNAANITGHLDAALVALQTAQDDLALAALLARKDEEMQSLTGQFEVGELYNVSGAVAVAQAAVEAQQNKWHTYLSAREAEVK